MAKSIFDRLLAGIGLVFLLPFLILIAVLISIDSRGLPWYVQNRIGLHGKPFGLLKFRTMKPGADRLGKLTVGARDNRITRLGYYLRKYKIDELPQLFNVLKGDMSLVGPRPEVAEYVAYYSAQERKVLEVKPGITDYASLQYFEENRILAESLDPIKTYIEVIMPAKLAINLNYLERRSFREDLKIIVLTILRILR